MLEGELTIPAKTGDEGPFGEFCGYTTAQVPNERIMTIKAVTQRRNPVYHNIWLGKPPHEHLYVDALTYAVAALSGIEARLSGIEKSLCAAVGSFDCFDAATGKALMRPGIVNNILAASLYTRSGKWKHVLWSTRTSILKIPTKCSGR